MATPLSKLMHSKGRAFEYSVWVAVFLLGIIAILVANINRFDRSAHDILLGVGIAFIGSAGISILQMTTGTDIESRVSQISDALVETMKSAGTAYAAGIDAVYPDKEDLSIFERFPSARWIDIMFVHGQSTIYEQMQVIASAIAENSCHVRILISSPDSLAWKINPKVRGIDLNDNVPDKIRGVIKDLRAVKQSVIERDQGGSRSAGLYEVRLFEGLPLCSLVIVNREIARYVPYVPYNFGRANPSFLVRRGDQIRPGPLFNSIKLPLTAPGTAHNRLRYRHVHTNNSNCDTRPELARARSATLS